MAKEVIFADANELNLLLKGRAGRESHLFDSSQVQRISFSRYTYRKFFGIVKKSARRITVVVKGLGAVEFDETKHAEHFESYLALLRKYAKENRVTFYDFPTE